MACLENDQATRTFAHRDGDLESGLTELSAPDARQASWLLHTDHPWTGCGILPNADDHKWRADRMNRARHNFPRYARQATSRVGFSATRSHVGESRVWPNLIGAIDFAEVTLLQQHLLTGYKV